jgi:LPS O-antigen subunit length determinant protein (WzzB/FepE family)
MNKNLSSHNDEIHITELLKSIWVEKKKISLIIFITTLIVIGFDYNKPNSYKGSLVVKPSKNLEFVRFLPIILFFNKTYNDDRWGLLDYTSDTLKSNPLPNQINLLNLGAIPILDRFIIEFMDYEELIFVLNNNKNIKKSISQLSENEQLQILYDYAKLFNFKKSDPKENYTYYTLNYTWHDEVEVRDILNQALELTVRNLEKAVFAEIEDFLEIKKKANYDRDLETIKELTEQSFLAKEFGLESLIIGEETLQNILNDQKNLTKPLKAEIKGYFIKGHKLIDKEINLIKNRKYENLARIKTELNEIKKLSINWVDYNIFLIDSFSQKNSTKNLIQSIVVGLILGVFYVLLSNSFKSRKLVIKK